MLGVCSGGLTACDFSNNNNPGSSPDAGFDGYVPTSATLTATPSMQDFGTVNLGAQSPSTMIVIANIGTQASGTVTVALTGDMTSFGIDSDGCNGMTVPGAKGCTIGVHFSPQTSGMKSASLSVSATPGGTLMIPLSGTGAAPGSLSISPTTKDLGSVVVGGTSMPATFTVTNNGGSTSGAVTLAFTGTDAADFALGMDTCSGKTLAAKATCTVDVTITPKTAGAKAGSLTATAAGDMGTATATLSATSLPPAGFTIMPTTYDFGSVPQGTMGMPPGQTFTVTNMGGVASAAPTVAVSGTNASDFVVSGNMCTTAVMPLATCTFGIIFSPTTPAAESATVTVSAMGASSAMATLTGTGVGSSAITITPTSQSFAPIVQGGTASADVPFTVKNTGTIASGALTVALGGSNANQFGLGTDGCTGQMLAPAATCTINAHFAPTATSTLGSLQASLTVSGTPGGTAAATLTATALAPAQITMTPASQALGTVVQGKTGPDFPFKVTNVGGVATGTIAVTLGGANKTDFGLGMDGCSGTTLAAGASCVVNAHLAPSATSTGAEAGTITASATPGGMASANLSANAIAPAALAWNTTSVSFPDTLQSTRSPVVTITLTNSGGTDSGLVALAMGGADPGQFFVSNDKCTGMTLAAHGGTCTVDTQFSPSEGSRGAKTATLTAGALPGGDAVVNFYGQPDAPAQLVLSQLPIPQWTGQPAFQYAPGVTFTVSNIGDLPSGPVSLGFVQGTDSFSIPFVGELFPCTGPLAGGAACSFTVRYYPINALPNVDDNTLYAQAKPGGTATAPVEGSGQWQLTVIPRGGECTVGTGNITSDTGLSCPTPDTCTALFHDGDMVTLTETPDVGSYSQGWSGPCGNGVGNTCGPITMTTNNTVTAYFCVGVP
jgi:hypothetical protein